MESAADSQRNITFPALIGLMALDRILKTFALSYWDGTPYAVTSWFTLGLERNTGIAWGLGSSHAAIMQIFLGTCMIAALIGITYRGILQWCSGESSRHEILIIIGGLSNLFDRIQYGAVIDFIQIFIGNYRLSVFNIADIYIVVGLLCILKKAWSRGTL